MGSRRPISAILSPPSGSTDLSSSLVGAAIVVLDFAAATVGVVSILGVVVVFG